MTYMYTWEPSLGTLRYWAELRHVSVESVAKCELSSTCMCWKVGYLTERNSRKLCEIPPPITTTPDPLSIKRNMWIMKGNLIGRITSHYGWTLLSDFCMWPFKAHDFTLKRLESGDSYDSLVILRSENNSSHFGIRLGNLRVVLAVPLGQTRRSVVRLYVTVVRWPMRTKCHLRAQCNSARTYNPRRTSFWSRIPKVPSRSVYPTGSSTKGGGAEGGF